MPQPYLKDKTANFAFSAEGSKFYENNQENRVPLCSVEHNGVRPLITIFINLFNSI